ncbi:nitroreductase family protein [Roseibium porphyridii]|uniref:Nitroreductase family protein n=1 Tax=Roseibium porphyridii TaxID=2866279 RepID=A0ABY8FBC2_9HYPH|nr:nitroreductase family protein [Roseibium sp. KMA01]WFE91170.1 nitroreductase family protein [Roseibium sp. KMA01]
MSGTPKPVGDSDGWLVGGIDAVGISVRRVFKVGVSMNSISDELNLRYGELIDLDGLAAEAKVLKSMLERGSCRLFQDRQVEPGLFRLLCAAALASPTKSDLQQRDIIIVRDETIKERLLQMAGSAAWLGKVPNIAVFCGNNRRQRQLHALRGRTFANDHLDAFFNAAVDAGIALSAFVTAAEAVGLGCCPISAIRNEAGLVSELLALPDHVFPVAGLAFGYPVQETPTISLRLPLSVTVHEDCYHEDGPEQVITDYDTRREAQQPYDSQRATEVFGTATTYGWSEDKSRQYSLPERDAFGAFVRAKGFNLS